MCTGTTGQAEAIQITFDPEKISFGHILDVFWHLHNPTTLNQQGNDKGTQYRSAIFYHDEKQKAIAENVKADLEKSGDYDESIITEIVPFTEFFIAEEYHKDYFDKNKDAPYCDFVINPKITKLLEKYGKYVKEEYK